MGLLEVGVVVYIIAWMWALVDIMRSNFRRSLYQLLWLLAIFLVPVAGVPAYFVFGRYHKIEKHPKHDVTAE